jgi:hypothetical protein
VRPRGSPLVRVGPVGTRDQSHNVLPLLWTAGPEISLARTILLRTGRRRSLFSLTISQSPLFRSGSQLVLPPPPTAHPASCLFIIFSFRLNSCSLFIFFQDFLLFIFVCYSFPFCCRLYPSTSSLFLMYQFVYVPFPAFVFPFCFNSFVGAVTVTGWMTIYPGFDSRLRNRLWAKTVDTGCPFPHRPNKAD